MPSEKMTKIERYDENDMEEKATRMRSLSERPRMREQLYWLQRCLRCVVFKVRRSRVNAMG